MNKNKKALLLIIGVLLLVGVIISISYAYYIFSVSQSGKNVVKSDCFEITYSDGNAISLNNAIPYSEDEADELTPYTFNIKNLCKSPIKYNINLETLNTSDIDLNAVRYKFGIYNSNLLGSIADNDSSVIVNKNVVSSSKTINSGVLDGGEEKVFDLRIWVDEDATIEQSANKSFLSKIVVDATIDTNFKSAYLAVGSTFNERIKKLVNSENTYTSEVSEITSFQRSEVAPSENISYVDVADSTSKNPVLVWLDSGSGTLYYYTNANAIFLNSDSSYMFSYLTGITSFDLGDFNTSKVTNMSYMFYQMSSVTSIDLGNNFDTSNVTDMQYMFNGMVNLLALDLGNMFYTNNVTNMGLMFSGLNRCADINLRDNFDTSNVTNMNWMFNGLNAYTLNHNLDLGDKFDTSKVTEMAGMFSFYHGGEINLGNKFNTSNVITMYRMFYGAFRVSELDLSGFDTSNVGNMSGMFYNMTGLNTIYVSDKFVTSSVWGSEDMFYNDVYLVGGAGTTYNENNITKAYAHVDGGSSNPGYFTLK